MVYTIWKEVKMTELILESIADNSNFTQIQMRKIKNLKEARENAQDLGFKELWDKKQGDLICDYLQDKKPNDALSYLKKRYRKKKEHLPLISS
jgi:hypothetical protein